MPVRAEGATGSTTPGTAVVDLQAAGSSQFIAVDIVSGQVNAANTQMTITVVYSDSTSTSFTTTAAVASFVYGNNGGIQAYDNGALSTITAFSAKAITRIQVLTAGTGSGFRQAVVSAVQIPL